MKINKQFCNSLVKILPSHVLTSYISNVFPKDVLNNIEVGSIKDNVLIISCKNSSVATLMRFEKQRFIDLLRGNNICKIDDIKVTIINYD